MGLTVFRVNDANFDNMPMYEVRKILAQLVCDKLREVFHEEDIDIRAGNEPSEGDRGVITRIAYEMQKIIKQFIRAGHE